MLDKNFATVLLVTGVITALPVVQFFLPGSVLRLMYKLELREPAGLLFARHWGLMAACFGALLIYAASHPEVRAPIVAAAMVEKAGLALVIFAAWSKPHARGMRLAGAFDAACALIFAAWLSSR
jgi:hypothetical protein